MVLYVPQAGTASTETLTVPMVSSASNALWIVCGTISETSNAPVVFVRKVILNVEVGQGMECTYFTGVTLYGGKFLSCPYGHEPDKGTVQGIVLWHGGAILVRLLHTVVRTIVKDSDVRFAHA